MASQLTDALRVATAAYEAASAALGETRAELKEAKRVVAEWANADTFQNKTLQEWKQEVEKLEQQMKNDEKREEQARTSFDRAQVQGNSVPNH